MATSGGGSAPVTLWHRLASAGGIRVPLAVLAVQTALTLFTGLVTLRNFPNSADEYSYLLAAETFARGRLSVPSPPAREFFSTTHVVNDGRYYSKYPPGWPLLLAPAAAAGVPWLVNPLLGAAALWVVYWTARRHASIEVANAALFAAVANPFLVFNNASYFSHASCLLFVAIMTYFVLEGVADPSRARCWMWAGLSAGAAFLVRPFTAVAAGAALGGWLLWEAARGGRGPALLRGGALLAVAASVGVLASLGYNLLQTGDALKTPFELYDPADRPDIAEALRDFGPRLRSHVAGRLLPLAYWLPLAPAFLAAWPAMRGTRSFAAGWPLAALFAAELAAHVLYAGTGGFQYGPRYLFETSGALLILTGWVLVRFRRWTPFLLAGLLLCNAAVLVRESRRQAREVRERAEVYDLVRSRRLSNAVVFLKTGSGEMPAQDLARNGTRFDGPVLFALDLAGRNAELLRAFPGRKAWTWVYDYRAGDGSLVPFDRR